MVKNFLPALLVALLSWLALGLIIFFLPPNSVFILIIFFLLLFLAVFLTLSLVLANSRRGFLLAFGGVGFLVLRFFNIANYLNLILLLGILISLELYLKKR